MFSFISDSIPKTGVLLPACLFKPQLLLRGARALALVFLLALFPFAAARAQNQLVSHIPGSTTVTANNLSGDASVSADGRFVAYDSFASNLVSGQSSAASNGSVYLYDRTTDTNVIVSHSATSNTSTGDRFSFRPQISADGRFVVYSSVPSG